MALYESQECPSVARDSRILRTTKPAGFLDQPGKHCDHSDHGKDVDQPGDEPAEARVDDVSLHPCPGPFHSGPATSSGQLPKVVRVAHWAHQLRCQLGVIMVSSGAGLPVGVRDARGERVGELGAEAEVGVEEVEEEVERALLDQVGDEPEMEIFCGQGQATDHLNCFLSVQRSRVRRAMH